MMTTEQATDGGAAATGAAAAAAPVAGEKEGGAAPAAAADGGKAAAPAATAPAAAAPAAAAFDPASFVGALSDENKAVWTAKGWAHPNDLFQSYTNMEKVVGGKGLVPPNVAEPEKLAEWEGWKALGVPEKADAYEIKRPSLEAGISWDETFEKQARDFGVMFKIPPFQLQGMVDLYAAKMNGQAGQHAAAVKAQIANVEGELRTEWGGEADVKMDMAKAAARHFMGGEIDQADLDRLDTMLGSKNLMKMMAHVGASLAEAQLIGGGKTTFGTNATGAAAELQKLSGDTAFQAAVTDRNHPNHKAAIERRAQLYKLRDDESAASA